ncbi:unnamed protein product [Cuscuta europaea]|uniref:HAT C-terminal dimerisation domain-containing protein n=1 Tax=Cuscuta europaea TaxID=41803 RepID=A0A9P1EGN7_CUSEU|nr:unnamed protein product [Cuscuta europaea]
MPDVLDWIDVESFVTILKHFYEMTLRISGSLYVTSNTFFSEISDLFLVLKDMVASPTASVSAMGSTMKSKLDKYWGDPEKMNYLIFYANVLDPRDKFEYMPFQLNALYGDKKGAAFFLKVKSGLTELFVDYVSSYPDCVGGSSNTTFTSGASMECGNSENRLVSRFKADLKKKKLESGQVGVKKSELDIYLAESIIEEDGDFDILRWWKLNSERFPILSKMARDVLGVPISTVASESTFSTSSRVLDCFRSSLSCKIVEALICAQDWLRLAHRPISIEENIDEVERLEKEIMDGNVGGGTAAPTGSSIVPLSVHFLYFYRV